MPLRIVLLGPPGSGKGTVCESLCKRYGLVHISTGDLLRDEVARGTTIGKKVQALMAGGQFVPDEIICDMVLVRLKEKDCVLNGWILDGFPRTVPQVHYLNQANIAIDVTLVLHIDSKIVVERMQNRRVDPLTKIIYNLKGVLPSDPVVLARLVQREDDKPDTIRKRMDAYQESRHAILAAMAPCHVIHMNSGKAQSEVLASVMEQLTYFIEMSAGKNSMVSKL